MAEPQLVDYIKKAKEIGQSDDQTRSLLYKNGWTIDEVNEAFSSITSSQSQPPAQAEEPKAVMPDLQTQSQPQPQPQMQPQSNIQTQPQIQNNPQPQLQQKEEPIISAQLKPDLQIQSQPQPQTQMQSQPKEPAIINTQSNFPIQAKKSHTLVKILMVLIILIVVAGGGYFLISKTDSLNQFFNSSSVQTKNNKTSTVQQTLSNFMQPVFAQYNLQGTKYAPSLPNYQIGLSELTNLPNFQKVQGNLSAAQTNALITENFFIAKNNDKFYSTSPEGNSSRNDDWTGLYQTIGGSSSVSARQPQNSVFITTDFLTHTYGKLVDEEFSYIEQSNFYPTLDGLSKNLLNQAALAYNKSTDPLQKESYDRLSAYFMVTTSILENAAQDYQKFQTQNYIDDSKSDTKASVLAIADSLAKIDNISDNAKTIAEQELSLIFDAKVMAVSPLMGPYQPGTQEDYTQYAPRSHYTANVILRDYFRAMMYYGRMNFLLSSPQLTRDAANIAQLMTPDELNQWESIYQPTSFFVGQSDDLTIYEINQAELQADFKQSDESDAAIAQLQSALSQYKNPQIMSSVVSNNNGVSATKGFRFMGQRFTPDEFIFSTLTQQGQDITTGQTLPSTPTALMVSTLMGSKESATLLNTWIKNNAPNSDKVIAEKMTALQTYFSAATPQQWTQNIYWSWLYTIKSLFTDLIDKTGYPMFVKSEDWDKKSLQGFLGSWTELKHDTLLYSKQNYAVSSAFLPNPPNNPTTSPVPKGYVEPNVNFFDRLIALVNMTNNGLTQLGILPANLQSRNATFLNTLTFYRTIAVSELQNQTISDSDFEKLRLSAGQLDSILQSPISGVNLEKNARSAVIADVSNDTVKNKILYEADGIPNYIYVAVKDANGTRLTKGLVYSYYEFTGPVASRYTDQIWQGWEYSSIPQKLQMPWWNGALVK